MDDTWRTFWSRYCQPDVSSYWWEKLIPQPAPECYGKDAALRYMADWFQRATVGSCIRSLSRLDEFLQPGERATGPHHDYTWRVDRVWDKHDQVHGPLFEVKTRSCAKKPYNFIAELKTETFERHALECANQILHSKGAFESAETVTETCPTCEHKTPRIVSIPSQGSGFVERVGRYPNPETDKWRLMYRNGHLLRHVQVSDTDGYYLSIFRLVIDSAGGIKGGEGGRPYYWRLEPQRSRRIT